MVDVSQEQRCPRCGGMLDAGATGSITQWLRVCHCNIASKDEPETEVAIPQICFKCGRRIGSGRQGSLTQWIFRPDLCDCEKPEPRDVDETDLSVGNAQDLEQFVEDEQLELEVDSTKWPSLRYKPLALLGHGAFGTIYRCHDRLLNKTIALKMMRLLTSQQLVAFQQEARATSRVTHPNIVQVYDFGATDTGAPFMTMEYVNGISLDQALIDHGTLTVDQAINVFGQVCDALAHAHGAGVMHRDIKSSNILLTDPTSENPTVKLIDFGVALFRTEEGTNVHVQGSTIAGSPNYMAPDQVLGKTYDERSEIYAIGSTIFEALTGRTPFEGEHTLDTLRQQASTKPPRLADIKPQASFSDDLENLVARCLAKDQASRYQSMIELKEALDSLRESQEEVHVPEPEPPIPTPVVPPTDRKSLSRSSPVVITLFLVLIVTGAIVGLVAYNKANKIAEAKTLKTTIPDIQYSMRGTADTMWEAERPRFIATYKDGIHWLSARGAVSDEDMVALKGRKDYDHLTLAKEDVVGKGFIYIDAPIRYLTLSLNPVEDQYLGLLKKHKNLEALDLDHTKVSDAGLKELAQFPRLERLNIGGGRITDSGLIYFTQMKHLTTLHLMEAPEVTPSGISTLARASRLEYLALTKVNVGTDLTWLKKLPLLEEVALHYAGVTDQALEQLSNLHLSAVSLKNNPDITSNGLKKLARIKELKILKIEGSPKVSKNALTFLTRSNPRLEINPIDEAKAARKRHETGFEAETGDVFKDILEINATDREIWKDELKRAVPTK